jgi:hypothetical protein
VGGDVFGVKKRRKSARTGARHEDRGKPSPYYTRMSIVDDNWIVGGDVFGMK